jgi:hypothetical protein
MCTLICPYYPLIFDCWIPTPTAALLLASSFRAPPCAMATVATASATAASPRDGNGGHRIRDLGDLLALAPPWARLPRRQRREATTNLQTTRGGARISSSPTAPALAMAEQERARPRPRPRCLPHTPPTLASASSSRRRRHPGELLLLPTPVVGPQLELPSLSGKGRAGSRGKSELGKAMLTGFDDGDYDTFMERFEMLPPQSQ